MPETGFDVSFASLVPLYLGVSRVWIGDGTSSGSTSGDNGVLYTELQDGTIQRLGPVTSYYYALQNGYTGTFQEWTQLIIDGSSNAQAAAMWATGGTSGTPSATNNAKYYSDTAATLVEQLRNYSITNAQIDALFQ